MRSENLLPILNEKGQGCLKYNRYLDRELPYSIETCQLSNGSNLEVTVSDCSAFAPLKIDFHIKEKNSDFKKKKLIQTPPLIDLLANLPLSGNYFKLDELLVDEKKKILF